jgi:hypothetical protein
LSRLRLLKKITLTLNEVRMNLIIPKRLKGETLHVNGFKFFI